MQLLILLLSMLCGVSMSITNFSPHRNLAKPDKILFDVTLVCPLYNCFKFSARINEYDTVLHDYGNWDSARCANYKCEYMLSELLNGDGLWDSEYEVKVELTHDCTEDRSPKNYVLDKPDAGNGYWIFPVNRNSTAELYHRLRY